MINEKNWAKRAQAFVAAALLAIAPVTARAQADYPNRTIKIIVPIPPGPMLDVLPRIVAEKLSAEWKEPVIIENRPGFAQNLGAEVAFKADPDGYTLLFAPPGPLVISQYFYPKLEFDPNAFVPITVLVKLPATVVANPKLPVSTLPELIAYAKANPNKISYGSPGAGSTPQLAMEKLQLAAGIHLVHVPYQGLGPAMVDLVAGHIDLMIDNLGNVIQHVRNNELKLLAVTTATRQSSLPDVPAVSETLPGYEHEDWFAFVAPPKTPPAIAARLSQAIAATLKLPDVAGRLSDYRVIPVGSSPEETATWIERERARWHEVIAASGAKPN